MAKRIQYSKIRNKLLKFSNLLDKYLNEFSNSLTKLGFSVKVLWNSLMLRFRNVMIGTKETFENIIEFIVDITLGLFKAIIRFPYSWFLISLVFCITVTLFFKTWIYADQIWMSIIITLLIGTLIETLKTDTVK